MMVLSALRPDASLVEFLEYRARSAPVSRLIAQAIVAFALVSGGFSRLPFAKSVVGTFGGAYFCYAVWGLLDRARTYSTNRGRTLTAQCLKVLCGLFVGIGVLSGLVLLLAIWFLALGSSWQL